MKKLLVILGPTATGKTDMALDLAKKYDGELVSCDSRQVYRGLDIGAGKEASKKLKVKKQKGFWEVGGIKIWMYDVIDPKTQYTVSDYIGQAEKVITDIAGRNKLPIIAGGTGLYLRGLLEGLSNLGTPVDKKLREELKELSLSELQEKLQNLSPARWDEMNNSDRNNSRRLLRSIELISMYGYAGRGVERCGLNRKFNVLKIGLTSPRGDLNKGIDLRLLARLNRGLIEEAEMLHQEGLSLARMKELGLEYGELARFLGGEISREEMVKNLSTKIHRYAKRQMTWFKKEPEVRWFDIAQPDFVGQVEKCVQEWYYSGDE